LINFLSNLLLGEKNELKNRHLHIQWEDVTDNVTNNVTDRASKILTLIKENNFISTVQMATILSVSKRTILRDIEKLKKENKIKREGNEKTGHWILNF
jgi:ATP-dependent DNA helicase RecG